MGNEDENENIHVHSTFYYKHRFYLKVMPGISDFECDNIQVQMVIIVYILNQEVIYHTQIVKLDSIQYCGKNNNNKKKEKVNLKDNCINKNGSYSEKNGYSNK